VAFKHGDVVELKSGGPKMTVTAIVGQDPLLNVAMAQGYTAGDVAVEYFNDKKLERGMFKQSSIKLSEQ
jgi:uncharacterized protein YodC (DUF2158 family)